MQCSAAAGFPWRAAVLFRSGLLALIFLAASSEGDHTVQHRHGFRDAHHHRGQQHHHHHRRHHLKAAMLQVASKEDPDQSGEAPSPAEPEDDTPTDAQNGITDDSNDVVSASPSPSFPNKVRANKQAPPLGLVPTDEPAAHEETTPSAAAKKLLDGYDAATPPADHLNAPVPVALGFRANKLLKMDMPKRLVTFAGWVRQYWYDPRLSFSGQNISADWDTDENFLTFKTGDVWIPDTTLINSVDFNWGEACGDVEVFAYEDDLGRVINTTDVYKFDGKNDTKPDVMHYNMLWARPCVYTAKCDISLRMYPFDWNVCPLDFQPWAQPYLDLRIAMDALSSKVNLPEFAVQFVNVTVGSHTYSTSGDIEWPDVVVRLQIARHGHYYVVNYICPMLFLVLLTWFALWIPQDASDRVAYLMTMVLTVMATQSINAEKRPATDMDMWMDDFQMVVLCLVVGSTLYAIWYIRLLPKDDWPKDVAEKRLALLKNVERMTRILFPATAFSILGALFLQVHVYEEYKPGEEKNFSGSATILAMLFCLALISLKFLSICFTWFPHKMGDAGRNVLSQAENLAHKQDEDLEQHRYVPRTGCGTSSLNPAMQEQP